MKRGIAALLLAAVALTLCLRAAASEVSGSLEIKLDAGELPVTNGAVTIYLVGIRSEDGYRVLDRYGGGVIRDEDIESGHLALWLAELADGGRTLLLDVDGRVMFSGLEEGLYLVEQTEKMDGFYPFRAFLVTMPSGGQWEIQRTPAVLPIAPEPPQTGQDLETVLAAAAMGLSGVGLVLCWIGEKQGKQRDKK